MVKFSKKEYEDIKRGLLIAMQKLDEQSKGSDHLLSDRLEMIVKKIDEQ